MLVIKIDVNYLSTINGHERPHGPLSLADKGRTCRRRDGYCITQICRLFTFCVLNFTYRILKGKRLRTMSIKRNSVTNGYECLPKRIHFEKLSH